jgi:uncharacterized protein involved in type VI secretion and phage assembly
MSQMNGIFMNGVVAAVVVNRDDPDNLGRVKVRYSFQEEGDESYWVRIATLMSGNRRGSWFMPEVKDEVLVAFDNGDMQNPYIVGFLWNEDARPPNEGIDANVRRLQTVSGHVLEFDDRPGQPKITLTTRSGYAITINETTQEINISAPTVTINCSQANITAATGSINITATGLNITAPQAVFSGSIQAAAYL